MMLKNLSLQPLKELHQSQPSNHYHHSKPKNTSVGIKRMEPVVKSFVVDKGAQLQKGLNVSREIVKEGHTVHLRIAIGGTPVLGNWMELVATKNVKI